jgi:hypothetical protein
MSQVKDKAGLILYADLPTDNCTNRQSLLFRAIIGHPALLRPRVPIHLRNA